jgi:hypothetical protein
MNVCFPEPTLRWVRNVALWVTEADVCCLWNGILINVPAGFYTDLATIPWPLVGIPGASRFGHHNRACVIHDWLYMRRGRLDYEGVEMTRREVDRLFLDLMLEDGVVAWKAYTMWAAVRLSPTNWRIWG